MAGEAGSVVGGPKRSILLLFLCLLVAEGKGGGGGCVGDSSE